MELEPVHFALNRSHRDILLRARIVSQSQICPIFAQRCFPDVNLLQTAWSV